MKVTEHPLSEFEHVVLETPLKDYVLHYVEINPFTGQEIDLYWRCQAEDYAHAVEQLHNAEPDVIFEELYKCAS